MRLVICLIAAMGLLTACRRPPAQVDAMRLVAADREADQWLSTGRTYDEQRFSPLRQIDAGNVAQLSLAWYADLGTDRGQEATPIEVDGVLYIASAFSEVLAFDARSGALRWRYDPGHREALRKSCCGAVNRGVAVWQGRVYVGALDGRLIALDARNGKPVWITATIDAAAPNTITGAPRIIRGKVIIGNGGAEFAARGYVSAYDAADGHLVWRFYTVPGNPAHADGAASDQVLADQAVPTWHGEWWKLGGGGTVWDSMAYDAALDLLYIGTGNGGPWNQAVRSPGGGDNLFLSSIVALRPDTGQYVWHFQETPGDSWDYTATQHIVLADIEIAGHKRPVLLQAPKNGFFYVIDRSNGQFISAQNYVRVTWASGVDPRSGRPIETPEARYYQRDRAALLMPSSGGGHNWPPMAYSPRTGLVYIPTQDVAMPYAADTDPVLRLHGNQTGVNLGGGGRMAPETLNAALGSMRGYLLAWDPATQRQAWRVELAAPFNGGVLATAGDLVFAGDLASQFSAYRAQDGQKLWSFATQAGVVAAPISYAIAGEQYVAVLAGWGGAWPISAGALGWKAGDPNGPNRLLVFKLGGSAVLPPKPARILPPLNPPPQNAPSATVSAGADLFGRYCARCHGVGAVSASTIPDLRRSAMLGANDVWRDVVLRGRLASQGMGAFDDELQPGDVEAIRAFVIARAQEDRAAGER